MLEIFYPGDFQAHARSFEEWSMHHWMKVKQEHGLLSWFYPICTSYIYKRALAYGFRPEFAWEFANQ